MSIGVAAKRVPSLLVMGTVMAFLIVGNLITDYRPPSVGPTISDGSPIQTETGVVGPPDEIQTAINARPLFVEGRGVIVTAPPPPPPDPVRVVSRVEPVERPIEFPPLVLVGTMISGNQRLAVLRNEGEENPIVMAIGEELQTWELRIIEIDRASFTSGERSIEIELWGNAQQEIRETEVPPVPEMEVIPTTSREPRQRGTRTRRPIGDD